jgi:histidinol-phosphate aminotransferase
MLAVMTDQPVHLRPVVAGLPAYIPGKRASGAERAFKLSSNENPFPPLPGVLAAIADAAPEVNRYPDMYAAELCGALARRCGVDPARVVVGCGSVALLGHLLAVTCDPGDEVVYAWRSFEAYPIYVQLSGATAVRVPVADDGRLDLLAMAAAVTERTRVVLICSPNNPTGPAVRAAELEAFLDVVPPSVVVALDEAYVEFVRDPEAPDALAIAAARPNVVVLRTFSKAYGLAGLRVGYAVAEERLANALRIASTPFGVSNVAQRAALAALEEDDEAQERVDWIVAERDRVVAALRAQGWALPESQANFVWLPLGTDTIARAQEAEVAGVIVRPFAGDGMRVTIGVVSANDLFLELAARWR